MRSLYAVAVAALATLLAIAPGASAAEASPSRALRVASSANDTSHATQRTQFPANYDGSTIHIVFSVSCDQPHRLLLTTVLQDSAIRVGQTGPMTQIISGCSDEQKQQILAEPHFYYDYRVHFTPSYSPHPDPNVTDAYTPYNKPFGLRHYLQHADPPVQHDVLALIDSDFVFFQPLQVNTGRNMSQFYKGKREPHTVTDEVRDGVALAQDWRVYMGSGWFGKETGKTVCAGQPCADVSEDDGREYYAGTGPPYIMTRHDMAAMVDDYCAFVVKGRRIETDAWMTEMYAYAVAAANHGVKHTILTHLGVTHPNMAGSEYWAFLPESPSSDKKPAMTNPCSDPFELVVPSMPPMGIHFCQSYKLREKGPQFYKYALPLEVVGCDANLLVVPSATEYATIDDVYADEDAAMRTRKRHEVWTECSLTKSVNHALLRLKRATCAPGSMNTYHGLALKRE